MKFHLERFNSTRQMRGAPAADIRCTNTDGESVNLWMDRADILANVGQFGIQPSLLLAGRRYGITEAELMEAAKTARERGWMKPVEPARDRDGYYTHPDYPFTEEMDEPDFDYWAKLNHIESAVRYMNNDPEAEEVNERYATGDTDILAWEPQQPEGDGWFVGSIHETEDGPVCVWLRHKEEA